MGEWRCRSTILDLGTSWRWVVIFTPRPLYPRRKTPPPHTHSIEIWMGPRTGLDDMERRKSCPYRDSELQPVARRYIDYAIADPKFNVALYINIYTHTNNAKQIVLLLLLRWYFCFFTVCLVPSEASPGRESIHKLETYTALLQQVG
jgi:hypothetical protein